MKLHILSVAFCSFITITGGVNPGVVCDPGDVDVMFVVDSSSSINRANFQLLRQFLIGLVQPMRVEGGMGARVGVVQFNETSSLTFRLDQFTQKTSLIQALSNLPYIGGETNIAAAMEKGLVSGFAADAGDRSNAPDIMVVLTDGSDNTNVSAVQHAAAARNITVIAMGLGPYTNSQELQNIAGSPKRVYEIASFAALQHYVDTLCEQIQNVNSCGSSPCQNGGVCSSAPGTPSGFLCSCPTAYDGPMCEQPSCDVDLLHTGAYILRVSYAAGEYSQNQFYLPLGVGRQFKALTGSNITMQAVLGRTWVCNLSPQVCQGSAIIRCSGTTFIGFDCTCN